MAGSLMVRSGKKIFVNDRLIEKKKKIEKSNLLSVLGAVKTSGGVCYT